MKMKNDFISRSKLLKTLRKEKIPYNADINYFITTAPAEDVAPVVRCRDCKKWEKEVCFCPLHCIYPDANDFCNYGERRKSKVKPRRLERNLCKECKHCLLYKENNVLCEKTDGIFGKVISCGMFQKKEKAAPRLRVPWEAD